MSKARDLANIISGSGTLNANVIPDLAASKITSGTIASARLSLGDSDIPNLATSKITSGTFADARISASSVNAHVDLTSLSASNLTSGTVPSARLSLGESDIPTLTGNKISGGTFGSVNGSSLTSLPSSAPTTSQVGTATSGLSAGAVGSYMMGTYDGSGGTKYRGDTYSGSSLTFAQADSLGGYSASGTWRCMGFGGVGTSQDGGRTSTWLRIS